MESPPSFIQGKRQKKPKAGLQTLRLKGSGVIFTYEKGISTPCVRCKGRQPLIKCAKSLISILLYFPLFMFFYFFWVDKSRAFAPTYPQLR